MLTSTLGRTYGWKPQRPDHRDLHFRLIAPPAPLPPAVSALTANLPIYDQGNLGSCTANGVGRLLQHRLAAENQPAEIPSRLFIYYLEREMEGSVNEDSGAIIRDGMKVLAEYGAPMEVPDWPYDVSQFAVRPPQQAFTDALNDIALQYQAVDETLDAIKAALAAGNPVVMGFTVFVSFEGAWPVPGMMPMPAPDEDVLGGHCVVIDGYDDARQAFSVANSWGTGWGENGWFWMPYVNLSNCSDFWVLIAVK